MPINLDSLEEVKGLDSKDMLGSIEHIGAQVSEVLAAVGKVALPATYKSAKQVVFLGMGGSTLGAHCIKSLFFDELAVPFEIVNGYSVPAYVGKTTLVCVVSYSGTTAESIAALTAAKQTGAKVVVITSGGELAALAEKLAVPALIFTTSNNPCGSPRMGLGYTNFGPLAILAKLGYIKLPLSKIEGIVAILEKYSADFGVAKPHEKNIAKQMAAALFVKSVWYVGAEHLAGNVHVAANQMNENAKRFAGWFLIPELNHHLMEGMMFPKSNVQNIAFVLVNSRLYDARIAKRFSITKEVLAKNSIQTIEYTATAATKFEQMAELLVLSSYVSFYSALLEDIDPTAIPFVDFFKNALKKV